MPEGLEAEIYRRHAEQVVGRVIRTVDVDPAQPCADALRSVLPGLRIASARRHGKLVLLDTDGGPTLGLHFGMTGRLVVDGGAAIDRLEYGSGRDDPAWDRLVLAFVPSGDLRVNDPRRLARFDLDTDEDRLGPDFLSVDVDGFGACLRGRRAGVKAVLLDQTIIAGFGNLCVDEILWQAGVAPTRPVDRLSSDEIAAVHREMREHLPAMLARGGSHLGTISPSVRSALPPCPKDGAPLCRSTIAGRTTVWCPVHQR